METDCESAELEWLGSTERTAMSSAAEWPPKENQSSSSSTGLSAQTASGSGNAKRNENAILGLQENAGAVCVLLLLGVFASHLTHSFWTKRKCSDIFIISLPLLCWDWASSWEIHTGKACRISQAESLLCFPRNKPGIASRAEPKVGFWRGSLCWYWHRAALIHSAHSFYLQLANNAPLSSI